jgi:outer membrane protein assembly factor BamD (BamD/ComL family)
MAEMRLTLFVLFFILLVPFQGFSAYVVRNGKMVDKEEMVTGSIQEHYSEALAAFEKKDWKELRRQTNIIRHNFSGTLFSEEVIFLMGVGFFEQGDYEWANVHFSEYLAAQAAPKHFEEAINYKFEIAEKFREGARKHLMGFKTMPKWMKASTDALSIYDEVIAAMPHHDLAAHSLYAKGNIYLKAQDFRSSIEAYQTLIRRFPKHPLAAESYVGIAEVYLSQSKAEFADPDTIDLAELNLRKFRASFPGEEKFYDAQAMFVAMQEHYAESLWETARYFERTKKPGAAKIYYHKIMATFPEAPIALRCKQRLEGVEEAIRKQEEKKEKAKAKKK